MNDAQSTISGLNSQDCPSGGWNGMPLELERATVADCLAHGVCGCIYGDAVQHIERLQEQLSHAVPAIEQLTKEREEYRTRWLASEVELRLALEARAHEQSQEKSK